MLGTRSKHIQYATIATPNNPLLLDCGKELIEVSLAYETFGTLNTAKDNCILITHALTGDSHVGTHPDEEELKGWWHDFLGPGLIFDTNKYFIICSNILGGCMGSTGPTSTNKETSKRFGTEFPLVSIRDMVNAQKRLIDSLEILCLHAVCGGSLGGMQVMQWAISYPNMVKAAIPIATTPRLSPQGIAFNEVGRRAIINDPAWNHGNYSADSFPSQGLALARMIAHITYLSDESMRNKFGRMLRNTDEYKYSFAPEFEVESYLNYQGNKFIKRFDANSYLYITKAVDYFDLEKSYGSLTKAFSETNAKFLIMGFSTDWLYPIYQSKTIVSALQKAGKDVSYCEIDTKFGHDAFLLEYEKMAPFLINFLQNI